MNCLPVCTLNAIPSFIPTADRTEVARRRWKRHFLAIRQLMGNDGIFLLFFSSIKENDDFRIISRMKLEGSVSSFPRDRSTKFIRRCRKFVVRRKSRIEKRIFARNDRWKSEIADLSKMVCSTLSTSATFHFSNLSSLSWRGFFFFLFDSKRVAKGFQNFRIARELRDVIVNVNIFVEIRGNIASNRKGESKTREEKGKKGNKNK